MSLQNSIEEDLLAEARTEVVHADHKASLVLAALGIGFSAFLAGLLASNWDPSMLDEFGEVLWWSGAASALGAVATAALAVWPRTGNRKLDRPIYYWGQAARFDSVESLAKRLDEEPPDRRRRVRDQLWHVSRLVSKKYQWIRWSIGLAGGSAVLFVIAGLTTL